MKIVLPGGSGQIGTILAREFSKSGNEVIVLSRRKDDSKPWQVIQWDGQTIGSWAKQIDGADVVINLAGRVRRRFMPIVTTIPTMKNLESSAVTNRTRPTPGNSALTLPKLGRRRRLMFDYRELAWFYSARQ